MAINVSVQYNGGLLPDIILLTKCQEEVLYLQPMILLRKASVARVDRRLRRYYLIVRLLPNVFALACLSLSSI